jgi:hypothetical protein
MPIYQYTELLHILYNIILHNTDLIDRVDKLEERIIYLENKNPQIKTNNLIDISNIDIQYLIPYRYQ